MIKKIDKKRSLNSGTTLIEVIGAIFVFSIAVQALIAVYLQSIQVGKRLDCAYTAYNLAKNRVEVLRSLNYTLLPSSVEDAVVVNSDGTPDPNGRFIRSTTITANYGGSALLTQAKVSVSYMLKGLKSSNPMEITTVLLNQ